MTTKAPPPFNLASPRKSVQVMVEAYEACEALRLKLEAEHGYSLKVGEFFSRMALKGVESTINEQRQAKGKKR